jgi:adenylate kinase family enzyme
MVLGQRISIVGTSGAGKTTVAAMAARRLRIPHIELDALRQGPNWTETPDEEFRRQVAAYAAEPNWVIDGNYAVVRDLVWDRATAIVWIDPPHSLIMAQVIWRSFIRAVTRRELWNGNKENMRAWLDPSHPIRWAFSTHRDRQAKYLATMGPKWIRLRSRKAIHHWLTTLSAGG